MVLAGTFVTYLDFFIVNVALPSIHAELGAGPAALQSVVAGFALTFALAVAAVGAVYYAAVGHGVAGAYGESLLVLAVITLFTAGLVPLLPRR